MLNCSFFNCTCFHLLKSPISFAISSSFSLPMICTMESHSLFFSLAWLAFFVITAQSMCVPIDQLSAIYDGGGGSTTPSSSSTSPKPTFQTSTIFQAEPAPIQSILDQNLPESPDVVTGIFQFDKNNPLSINIDDLFDKFNNPFSGNVDPELEKMCKSTDYINLCLNTISPILNGKNDIDSVIRSAIKVAVDYTNVAVAVAGKLAADKSVSERLASTIGDCKDSYNDALENFDDALAALPAKDVGTMNSMLSAAITDFSDVSDFLAGTKSPLLDYDDKLIKLTSNCLAISSLINPSPPPQ